MTRIAKILTRVRDTLADHQQDKRWDDAQLIRLVHEAQVVLVSRTRNLRSTVKIGRLLHTAEHPLPSDSLGISRVLDSNNVQLPLYSHDEMDVKYGATWESVVGDAVEAVVYDQNNPSILKLYPIAETVDDTTWTFAAALSQTWNPVVFEGLYGVTVGSALTGDTLSNDFGVVAGIDYVSPYFVTSADGCEGYEITAEGLMSTEFGVLSDLNDSFYVVDAQDEAMGVTVGLSGYSMSSVYGVAVGLADDTLFTNIDPELAGEFGVITAFMPEVDPVTVYFVKRPAEVTSAVDVLEVDRIFDIAIKYYVAGMALRDDKDAQNRAAGNEELGFFVAELEHIKTKRAHSNTDITTQYVPQYNSGF